MSFEIKSIWIDDALNTLEEYLPHPEDYFGVWVVFRVGVVEHNSADDFRVLVCSPKWVESEVRRELGGGLGKAHVNYERVRLERN